MQQLIVNVIVAAAILFLARWIFKSFFAKRREDVACGGCAQCATPKKSTASSSASAVQPKG